jgi:chromatin segregation and condensation protein Rec8/ScpA/Scc1 (kleisin family)
MMDKTSLAYRQAGVTLFWEQPETLTDQPISPAVAVAWRQIRDLPSLSVGILGRFVSDVAWLLWQKSGALLPLLSEPAREKEQPALDLAALQEDMAALRQAALWLGKREAANLRSFARSATVVPPPSRPEDSLAGVTLDILGASYRALLARVQSAPVPVATEPFPLKRMIEQIRRVLTHSRLLSFRVLVGGKSKRERVAAFLALLELAKQGEVVAEQYGLWGDIELLRP